MTTWERAEKGGPGSGHHGHRGRPGKRGGSAPSGAGGMREFLSRSPIVSELSPGEREEALRTLEHYKVVPTHLGGLSKITTTLPPLFFERDMWEEAGWGATGPPPEALEWSDDLDEVVIGTYESVDHHIGVSPRYLTGAVLPHEVGHHVLQVRELEPRDLADPSGYSSKARRWGAPLIFVFRNRYGRDVGPGWPEQDLAQRWGLRPNSTQDIWEAGADSYLAWLADKSPRHREELAGLWRTIGVNAEELFGP